MEFCRSESLCQSVRIAALLVALVLPVSAFALDSDGDGVIDGLDNCRLSSNASQNDSNSDGYGNRCDADLDDDGVSPWARRSLRPRRGLSTCGLWSSSPGHGRAYVPRVVRSQTARGPRSGLFERISAVWRAAGAMDLEPSANPRPVGASRSSAVTGSQRLTLPSGIL